MPKLALPPVPEKPIYFDYAATTPLFPEVREALIESFSNYELNANPGSTTHYYGQQSKQVVEQARAEIADLINADPAEIHYTSGATESNFLAIQGIAKGYKRGNESNHLITIATEHKATLNPIKALAKSGFEIAVLPVDGCGQIDLAQLEQAITPNTTLLALSAVNNETGIMPDLPAIAALCKARKVHLHIDAAQAFGKLPLDVKALGCATMSISAHKCYGPKGIGALYVRANPKVRLADVLHSGTQGVRAGTLATPLIRGFGVAAVRCHQQLTDMQDQLWRKRKNLLTQLQADSINRGIEITGADQESRQFPGIINLRIVGVRNIAVMQLLEQHVAISAGSACNSANSTPSHVLTALGKSDLEAGESIRISLGVLTSEDDLSTLTRVLESAINFL